jgi:hypothetical protein
MHAAQKKSTEYELRLAQPLRDQEVAEGKLNGKSCGEVTATMTYIGETWQSSKISRAVRTWVC